ncbi:MAG TPA: collagen-like protein, partial [Gaiellaceae bacterium]|nr:collagen-like protein [Gaiellaceae bacterium]
PKNSVGNAQLQSNAVTSSKVKDHTLLRTDFANGQLQRGAVGAPGPPGAQGSRGPTGAAGPSGTAATRWAFIGKAGNVIVSSTPAPVVVESSPGQYYVNFGSSVDGHAIVTSSAFRDADPGFRGTIVAGICGNTGTATADTITCLNNNNTSTVLAMTLNATNTATESHAFYIAVL